jgi:hypothetical protein
MATTANKAGVTLLDIASRLGEDNKIATIIEMLAQDNEILEDMIMVEGNLPTGHKTTIRTGLPSATWRRLNYGVLPSKSRTAQITDSTGMLEAYAEVDKALADLNGNTSAFRLSEDRAFLEAMNQEAGSTIFYGNEKVNDAQFTGLAARYAATSANKDEIGFNIVKVAGTHTPSGSDQTSIWLVGWGENTIHGIYPKGSVAGLAHKDLGEVTLEDADGGRYQGYRSHYKWDMGLTVRDWRYGVRICNLDTGSLTKDPAVGDIFDALDDSIAKMKSLTNCRPVYYCNRTVEALLRKQARKHASSTLTIEQLTENRSIVRFNGIPIKRCDAILNTEAVVV